MKTNRRGAGEGWAVPLAWFIPVAVALVYFPVLTGEFQLDDYNIIRHNPALLRGWGAAAAFWPSRALALWSFRLNFLVGGWSLPGFHGFNIALHAASALALYGILRILLGRTPAAAAGAFFGALFFAVHPAATQAVSYVVQRFVSLAGCLVLAAVLGYLSGRRAWLRGEGRAEIAVPYLAGLACFLGASFSKESALVLPAAILVGEAASSSAERPRSRRLLFALPWVLAVLVPLAAVAATAARPEGEGMDGFYYRRNFSSGSAALTVPAQGVSLASRREYLYTQLNAFRDYLALAAVPVGQAVYHELEPARSLLRADVAVSALLLSGFLLLGARLLGAGSVGGGGMLWFVLCLLPTSSVVVLWPFFSEHHLYLGLAGAGTVLAAAVSLASGARPAPARAAAWAVVFCLALMAFSRNLRWGTEVALWESNVRRYPASGLARYSLAGSLIRFGRFREGLREADLAAVLTPSLDTFHNRWAARFSLGRMQEALALAEEYARLNPGALDPWLMLAKTRLARGEPGAARAALDRAAAIDPEAVPVLVLTAVAAEREDDRVAEAKALERVLGIDPGNESALILLAGLRAREGNYAEADRIYRRALELHSESALAASNYRAFLDARRETDQAGVGPGPD
ncbi:MAG TPA: hypothetical protein PLI51_00010 [bacterium]|nr:hypothetical protein [bacterium]HPQ65094.1 hypothetical protein [bacterium]